MIESLYQDLRIIESPDLQKLHTEKENLERKARKLDRQLLKALTSGDDYEPIHEEWQKVNDRIKEIEKRIKIA